MDQDQRTSVAAMAAATTKPRRGQVIGERYEIRGKLRNDAFTRGFLAFDQEHEQSVLLRVIRAELLDPMVRGDVAERLRQAAGIGGSYLPGILDGDLDGPFIYATEPVPEGASMRDVLDRRIAMKRPLEPFELLPVVAHLDAALRAVPDEMRHGDVRAENVWTDSERLQLTGGFLLAAMPGGAVAAVVQRNTGLKRRFAREISIGGGMRSSDYFGAAALVYESLVLKAPMPDGRCDAVDPEIRQVLQPLMTPVPTERPTSLVDLIEVLARLAGLPVPELEPAPFKTKPLPRQPRESEGAAPDDNETVHDVETTIAPQVHRRMIPAKTDVDARAVKIPVEDDGLPPAPKVNENDKTQPRASIHHIKDDGLRKRAEAAARAGAELRKKRRTLTEAERRTRAAAAGLDPRLVRAALADNEEGSHHIGAVDTRAGAPAASATPPVVNRSLPEVVEPPATASKPGPKAQPAIASPSSAPPPSNRPPSRPPRDSPIAPELTGLLAGNPSESMEEPDPDDPFEQGLRMALGSPDGAERTSEGVLMDPSVPVGAAMEGTQEIGLDELEEHQEHQGDSGQVATKDVDFPESEDVPLDPSVPANAAVGGTQEISFDELHDMERAVGGGDSAPPVLLSDLAGMKREIPPVRGVPGRIDPADDSGTERAIPRPVGSANLFSSAPTAPPAQPPKNVPSAHAPAAAPPMIGALAPGQATPLQPPPPVTHAKTSPGAPKMRRAPAKTMQMKAPGKRGSDQWIIVGALLLGAMIIAGGLLYARHSREQKIQEQQQRLQERFEQTAAEASETSPE